MVEDRVICHCPACTPDPQPTYTPAYRLACEVRHLAKLRDREARARYLDGLKRREELIEGLKGMVR